MSLGQRGYEVVLADAAPRVLGGRVVLEARLAGPGGLDSGRGLSAGLSYDA